MIDTNGFDNAQVDQLLALDDRSAPMTKRKPQIAYAPVTAAGEIQADYIRESEFDAASDFCRANWELTGWRIASVRIELDEEKSGE